MPVDLGLPIPGEALASDDAARDPSRGHQSRVIPALMLKQKKNIT
jgi:hypothetical protein